MSVIHPSIPSKVKRIVDWLLDDSSQHILILYGEMATGKSAAFWLAIEQIAEIEGNNINLVPCDIYLIAEGKSHIAFKSSFEDEEFYTDSKTVMILTTPILPLGMADLLSADTMKFEKED